MTATNKKLLVIILVLIVIIPALFYGFFQKTDQTQNTIPNAQITNTAIAPTSASTAYQSNTYSVSYPSDWSKNEQELTNKSGTVVALQPSKVNPQVNPYVTIETADANLLTLNTMTQGFKTFGYKKTEVTVAGVPAEKYSIIMDTNEGVLHSTAYVFSSQGRNYMIKIGYKQNAVDPELESQFSQIVDNFKLD